MRDDKGFSVVWNSGQHICLRDKDRHEYHGIASSDGLRVEELTATPLAALIGDREPEQSAAEAIARITAAREFAEGFLRQSRSS
jgi:hypothetical protein